MADTQKNIDIVINARENGLIKLKTTINNIYEATEKSFTSFNKLDMLINRQIASSLNNLPKYPFANLDNGINNVLKKWAIEEEIVKKEIQKKNIELQKSASLINEINKISNKAAIATLFEPLENNKVKTNILDSVNSLNNLKSVAKSINEEIKSQSNNWQQISKDIISGFKPLENIPAPNFVAQISPMQKIIGNLNNKIKNFGQNLKNLTSPLLSLLFFGMMLQQVFTGALKSLFEGYKKAIPEASAFNVLTNKLSANWEYFKFQLADALANSSLFQSFIGFVIGILQWLQKLSPETKVWLGTTMAVLAGLGALFFVIGQIGLGLQGLGIIFSGLKWISGLFVKGVMALWTLNWAALFANLKTLTVLSWNLLVPWLPLIGTIAIVAAGMYALYKINKKHLNDLGLEVTGVWNNIKSVTITFLAGLANLFVQAIASIVEAFLLIGTAIAGIFTGVVKSAFNFGKAVAKAIIVGIRGGDWKEAFVKTFDFSGTVKTVMSTFETGLNDAFAVKDYTDNISKSINNWEFNKQLDWANATLEATNNIADMAEYSKIVNDNLSGLDLNNALTANTRDLQNSVTENNQTINLFVDGAQFNTTGTELGTSTSKFTADFLAEVKPTLGVNLG